MGATGPAESVLHTVDLVSVARQLTREGKGILAADESTGTIGKRLNKDKLENTEVPLTFRSKQG